MTDAAVNQHKILLDESRDADAVVQHHPRPARRRRPPPLHPGTLQPVGPDDLAPLFPMDLILQEVTQRAVRRHPRRGARRLPAVAASPLYRAHRLEKALGTPARIYYKYEGVSPGRLAQAEHRRPAGVLQRQGRRHGS